MRMIDRAVIDDDLGLGGTAASLRAVGLGLNCFLALCYSSLGINNGSGDNTLTAGTGQSNLLSHYFAPPATSITWS